MVRLLLISCYIFFFGVSSFLHAQLQQGGFPVSFYAEGMNDVFHEVQVSPPEQRILHAEDEEADKEGLPQRFAVHLPVNLNMQSSGTWSFFADGSRIWRLKLRAENALAVGLHFTDFYLPEGCELFLYDQQHDQVLGAFTSLNNRPGGLFATDLINGEYVNIDLYIPEKVNMDNFFTVSEVVYAYRHILNPNEKGTSGGDFCEVNINCSPEGDNWQQIKRGVVRIQVKVGGGSYWCTGSMINNTRNDHTPYLLTADHCAYQAGKYATAADLENWIFRFNHEGAFCESTGPATGAYSLTGATRIAQGGNRGSTGSDFYLVKLIDQIPEEKNVMFLGWSIENIAESSGVTIHHPDGDIKKVSTFTTPVETSGWSGNGLPSHWRVTWSETPNGWGVTEGGSSGSPLLNDSGRIIGTLTGGLAACEYSGNLGPDKPDFYGKFSYHWLLNGQADTLRLKPWLDPDNTGVTKLNGLSGVYIVPPVAVNKHVNIFPNPSAGKFTIDFSTFVPSDFLVKIYDLKGKVFRHCSINYTKSTIELDCKHLSAGIYMLELASVEEVIMTKLIIVH
jgi:hypothetical protein